MGFVISWFVAVEQDLHLSTSSIADAPVLPFCEAERSPVNHCLHEANIYILIEHFKLIPNTPQ